VRAAPELAALLSGRDARILVEIARSVAAAGGRALLVGGWVRDALLGATPGDLDLEVHGLPRERLAEILSGFGDVVEIGRSFGVFRIKGVDADVSLPRGDSRMAPRPARAGARGDPDIGFEEAARRRDLTINAMGFDPLRGEIIDPLGGRRDLERGIVRAASSERFGDDPLRALRVAQLSARLEMEPDHPLVSICAGLDLSRLPGERLLAEWRKLLARSRRPSRGLAFLHRAGLLRFFPELEDLVGVPQDAVWHPEGDVWVHTLMAMDAAVTLRHGEAGRDEALGFGVLAHDFGKPSTTRREGGRVRSHRHERAGEAPTTRFMERLRAPADLTRRVVALVRHHLAPALYAKQGASPKAYRRLARELAASGTDAALLERTARADHWGRTTHEARAGVFPAGEAFLAAMRALDVVERPPPDVVCGRHLIARGLTPGPEFGEILRACRRIQDETGETDARTILDRVLAGRRAD